jgi:hypothetical protein
MNYYTEASILWPTHLPLSIFSRLKTSKSYRLVGKREKGIDYKTKEYD